MYHLRKMLHVDTPAHDKTKEVAKLLISSSDSAAEEGRPGARNRRQKYKINDVSVCAVYFCIYFGIAYRMLVAARLLVKQGTSLNRHNTPKVRLYWREQCGGGCSGSDSGGGGGGRSGGGGHSFMSGADTTTLTLLQVSNMSSEAALAFVAWLLLHAKDFGDQMPTAESQNLLANAEENYEFRLPESSCNHARSTANTYF